MQHNHNGLAELVNIHTTALSDITQCESRYTLDTTTKRRMRNDETHHIIDGRKLPNSLQAMAGFIHEH